MSTFIILLQTLLAILGILTAFFIVWKQLREDYQESQIFSVLFAVLGGVLVSVIVMSSIYKPAIFWTAALTGFLAVAWRIKRHDMRFFEVIEGFVPALYILLIVVLGALALKGVTIAYGVETGLFILALLIYIWAAKTFRRFLWYPSGKIGIASLLSLVVYGFGRALLATLSPSMLFLSGTILDIVLGISLGILCLVVVYLRSGREGRRDFGFLLPKRK